MANNINQTVTQIDKDNLPKRVVVQYYDDVTQEGKQTITNYDDLTAGQKTTFDDYQTLCESLMV